MEKRCQLALLVLFVSDWRSGCCRDQTFMMALDLLNVKQYFAALYAHSNIEKDPASEVAKWVVTLLLDY